MRLAHQFLSQLCTATLALATLPSPTVPKVTCPIFYPRSQPPTDDCTLQVPATFTFLEHQPVAPLVRNESDIDTEALEDAFEALTVMQTEFFVPEQGTWPEAIDWTAAVMQTVLSGALTSLTQAFSALEFLPKYDSKVKSNLVDSFFTQLVGSYFGQDAVSLRHQAYDDILWVVLGWVDAMKFVHVHSNLHYPPRDPNRIVNLDLGEALRSSPWHGYHWVPAFAHRARIFWDTASNGWDEDLCNGGMTWNPRLEPYKNAVTNELWIAASISMYLWFPGDNNTSPWMHGRFQPGSKREPKYLAAAVEGYRWLSQVNMTNSAGLFIDGFHISARSKRGSKKCDLRSEMVFTYNQGVILTGQRGLWTATGSPSYLQDGHELIQSVIKATGWDLAKDQPADPLPGLPPGMLLPWRGLGRAGIMEERCDASGTCSQDGQTFKGIFFHHLVAFCEGLEPPDLEADMYLDFSRYERIATAHSAACQSYKKWVSHNARAALSTRDDKGRFGMWWGAGLFENARPTKETDGIPHDAPNTTDYRNYGIPHDPLWCSGDPDEIWAPNGSALKSNAKTPVLAPTDGGQQVLQPLDVESRIRDRDAPVRSRDLNDRGRGRTAETHNGGLALMRAWWELHAESKHLHQRSR